MKKKDKQIIIAIQNARSRNNKNWMNLLRLAFESSPSNSKKILRNIHTEDIKISNFLKKLSDK